MKISRLLLLFCLFSPIMAMASTNIYYVQFRDKANSPYSLQQPLDFLSQRSLDRRNKWNIPVDSTDIPVNPAYVQALTQAGASVKQTTRWLNGALIQTSSDSVVNAVRALSYVTSVELVYQSNSGYIHKKREAPVNVSPQLYGDSYTQVQMLGVDQLHNSGFNGRGIQVAVIDAGFLNVDINSAFDSLRHQGGILGHRDFVDPTSDIYSEDSHGAAVLATIAANIPNVYLGAAPKAEFWLLRSEDAWTEWPVEADYWIAAAEFADSVGVDIITSSLGYAMFDLPSFDYQYSDLDGRTLRISKAALYSARKGIVTLISAGNEGADDWGTISAPADADSILTVGAVNRLGQYAYFSSKGPSADGRVKPDICTVGLSAATVDSYGSVYTSNGTSFSCPIAAGMMACLLQSLPNVHPQQLIQQVRQSGSCYSNPDIYYGFGIPNVWTIYSSLVPVTDIHAQSNWCVYPNPVDSILYIDIDEPVWVQINDLYGRHHLHTLLQPETPLNLSFLTQGVYLVTVNNGTQTMVFRIIKQ